jgi:NADH dehydrogenase
VKPNPLIAATDLPTDDRGRLRALPTLQMDGVEHAWTAGDAAAVPDLTQGTGEFCSPSAQHAVRQARQLADNMIAVLRGGEPIEYRHSHAGSVASLGLHKGVAQVYGVKLKGYPAWLMHRSYHLSRVPTLNRKARVAADWTLALFFRREAVSLGAISRPYDSFRESAATSPVLHPPPVRLPAPTGTDG